MPSTYKYVKAFSTRLCGMTFDITGGVERVKLSDVTLTLSGTVVSTVDHILLFMMGFSKKYRSNG